MTTKQQEDLVYDIFNLCSHDIHPVDISLFKQKGETYMKEHAQRNIQTFMGKLFDLPTVSDDDGLFITLPKESVVIPREKPVPKEKKKTAWAEYAREKGIRDIKKDKLVYDKVNDEFRPRFGYGRANNTVENDWVMEEKQQPADKKRKISDKKSANIISDNDPFLKKQQAKQKLNKQQLKNQKRNMMKDQGRSTPSTVNIASIPKLNAKRARLDLKGDLKDAYASVAVSTASMGKFDKRLPKEHKLSKVKSKNRLSGKDQFASHEKSDNLTTLDRVLKVQAEKKRKIRANAANTFQTVMEQQSRGKKQHALAQNKNRFKTGGKDDYKKGGKGGAKGGQRGKKRSRSEVEF